MSLDSTSTIFDEQRNITFLKNTSGLKETLDNIDRKNIIPSFRRTSDPINLAFSHIENKPLKVLARDFVKDTIDDAIMFISRVFE